MSVDTVTTAQNAMPSADSFIHRLLPDESAQQDFTNFAVFLAVMWILRVVILKTLVAIGRSNYAETYRITKKPEITEKQLEREAIWKYGYGYDTVSLVLLYFATGLFHNMPAFEVKGLLWQLFFHATVVEFLYYWWHRALHWEYFYKTMHQYHHKSINTEPTTGVSFEILERLSYTALFAIAPILTYVVGAQSFLTFAAYLVWFDVMNEGGHINFEVFPSWLLNSPYKWLFYSPTYHSVHHTKFKKNYSLFMPWPDMLFSTAVFSPSAYTSEKNRRNELLPVANAPEKPLDFVLLVHGGYLSSVLYSSVLHPVLSRFVGHKYEQRFWMWLLYPWIIAEIFYLSLGEHGHHYEDDFSFFPSPESLSLSPMEKSQSTSLALASTSSFKASKSVFSGQTWIVRNFAVHYLMPSFYKSLEARIERAVLDAQAQKVRVVGLGNFNKAEWLNHGGADIIKNLQGKLTDTYVAHGDTLSAATVLQYTLQLRAAGYWRNSVFLTGSTSKIGRAVALGLAKRGIKVVMLSQCRERFDEIASELEVPEQRANLVYTASLAGGKGCDFWLTGKMIPKGRPLLDAIPLDSVIVNFSVPDPLTPGLLKSRPDLLHLDSGLLSFTSKTMAPRFNWLLPQGLIYACLGGCIVHSVLGIKEHEVGPVKVENMDMYWNAAIALGFSIPAPTSFYSPIKMPSPKHL